MKFEPRFDKRQSGAALIVALIFLLLMTLLSTSSMRSSTMQERMAGNMRDWNLGFQGAEAALRAAEAYLLETDNLPEFSDSNGFYQLNSTDRPVWVGATTDAGEGAVVCKDGNTQCPVVIDDVAKQPQYYVEQLTSIHPAGISIETGGGMGDIFYFKITAVGYGGATADDGTPLSAVVLSSVYRSR